MERYKLTVNGQNREVTVDPNTPLLWVLREDLKMTGTERARCMLPESPPGRAWCLFR